MKEKTTVDEEPRLIYKGRKIYVESNGMVTGTHIIVDGKELMAVTNLLIVVDAKAGFVKVVTTELDVGAPELPSAEPKPWVPTWIAPLEKITKQVEELGPAVEGDDAVKREDVLGLLHDSVSEKTLSPPRDKAG